jgi:hypothetical protein
VSCDTSDQAWTVLLYHLRVIASRASVHGTVGCSFTEHALASCDTSAQYYVKAHAFEWTVFQFPVGY